MVRKNANGERGVSTVVGVVVLVGMVAVVSVGVVTLGGQATADSRQEVENERIRQAFVEFQTDVDTVAQGDDDARTVALDLPDEGDGAVREERSGRIVVRRSNLSTTKTVVVQDVGAVVYENGETQYAYQAGAVWRGEGNATEMVSAPDVTYATTERGTDPTLTFPIVNLEGARRLGSDSVRIETLGTGSPLSNVSTVDDQLVVLEIRSDYYVGWGQYFRSRYENTVVSYDHPNDTVVIELGMRSINGDFDQAVYAMAGDYVDHHPAAGVDGEVAADGDVDGTADGTVQATGTFAELDPVIVEKVHRAETNASYAQSVEVGDGTTLTSVPGGTTYYDDDGFDVHGGSVTVDLSQGNVTLVLDGDAELTNGAQVRVVGHAGNDYAFRVYTTGNLTAKNGQLCVDPCGGAADAEHLQVYGTSEMLVGMKGGNTYFEGLLYAPRTDEVEGTNTAMTDAPNAKCDDDDGDAHQSDFCIVKGNTAVEGAVVAGPVKLAQSTTVEYDPEAADTVPTLAQDGVLPPPITYLHVSVHEVEVDRR